MIDGKLYNTKVLLKNITNFIFLQQKYIISCIIKNDIDINRLEITSQLFC